MEKKRQKTGIVLWLAITLAFFVLSFFFGNAGEKESIKEVMRDAVLHESNKISLFGVKDVNPAFISAMTVTAVLLVTAALIRIFAIPKFKMIPGKFQLVLEELVRFFDNLAKTNSPHRNGFLGARFL